MAPLPRRVSQWDDEPVFLPPPCNPESDEVDLFLPPPSDDALGVDFTSPKKRQRKSTWGVVRNKTGSGAARQLQPNTPTPSTSSHSAQVDFESDVTLNQTSDHEPFPIPTDEASEAPEFFDPYLEFKEGVAGGTCGFFQLTWEIFVVQGWDSERCLVTDKWYHLQRRRYGLEIVYGCWCPTSSSSRCVHQRYLTDNRGLFPAEECASPSTLQNVIPFYIEEIPLNGETGDEVGGEDVEEASAAAYHCLFSVGLPGRPIHSRTIVTLQSGKGARAHDIWKCQSDQRASDCAHIHHVKSDPTVQRVFSIVQDVDEEDGKELNVMSQLVSRPLLAINPFAAVSHLPIQPPAWAALPTDVLRHPRLPSNGPPPPLLTLNSTSRCACSQGCTYTPQLPTVRRSCTVYTLSESYAIEIELQACHLKAPNRHIGPDGRDHLIFNYNNSILFAHTLLDDYTSAFTTSETPFHAWVKSIGRRYWSTTSSKFVSDDVFRSVWFAYVNLQVMDGDMTCPRCKEFPDDTIWDGVTLAFSRKHLQSALHPPTTLTPDSSSHPRKYISNQQFIPETSTRRLVLSVISSKHLPTIPQIMTTDASKIPNRDDVIELLESISNASRELSKVHPQLGALFDRIFCSLTAAGQMPTTAYTNFFKQLLSEESILQTLTRPTFAALQSFISSPSPTSASMLIGVPVVYHVLREHNGHYPQDLLSVLCWMASKTEVVLTQLLENQGSRRPVSVAKAINTTGDPAAPMPLNDGNYLDDWRKTGCCYSMPQIRQRPRYPGLYYDQKQETGGSRGSKCSKYYTSYGQKRLTGGIMCAWCTHSICYGFHFIPLAEGRNDVFSAIYTRWPKAPKRIIYDFACALGPYCLTRETDFFADTSFNIDGFHAKGHTRCSPAAFLSSYSAIDISLMRLNSSAAECGNSGIGRIRKSVSYMSQERAILYTRVFMGIWNRERIRKLLGITD